LRAEKQFDKLSAIARKCAENTLAYHLENKFNKSGMDIDVRADMLKGIAGLNLGEQLERLMPFSHIPQPKLCELHF
jgi:hypothetical protein